MTEKEAERMTKYFCEGVCAHIWCYADAGNWAITIRRDSRIQYLKLDHLKRRLFHLKTQIERGDETPTLYPNRPEYPEDEMVFHSAAEAWACVVAIREALSYIQNHTVDPDWHDVPADIFESPNVMIAED